jgi:hypothetical protein
VVIAMIRPLCTAIRSYLLDLLPLPPPASYSEAVIFVCRVLGCATILGVTAVSIQHAESIPPSRILPFALLVLSVAVLVGNLIKELGILIGGIVLNWRGLEFRRTRLTLSGGQMREIYRPNGTWDGSIRETLYTIHEWSDLQGECHQEILDRGAPRAHITRFGDPLSG